MTNRTIELLLDPHKSPAIWFIGPALIILSLMFGIGLVNSMAGPSWAELCVSNGGEYHLIDGDADADTQDEESCDVVPSP